MELNKSELKSGITIEGSDYEQYKYDGLGRIIRQDNNYISIKKMYDSLNRNYQEDQLFKTPVNGIEKNYTIRRDIDLLYNLEDITYPSGRKIHYELDELNRITKILNLEKGASYKGNPRSPDQYEIQAIDYFGRREGFFKNGNLTKTSFSYDQGGRIVEIKHRTNVVDLLKILILYDGNNNQRLRIDIRPGGNVFEFYYYNSVDWLTKIEKNRIIQLFQPERLQPLQRKETNRSGQTEVNNIIGTLEQNQADLTYNYDSLGNRLSDKDLTNWIEKYDKNNLNQYSSIYDSRGNKFDLVYDLNGNIIEAVLQSGLLVTCLYDYDNRLIRVVDKNTNKTLITNYYDINGRRVATKTNLLTVCIFNGNNIIEEYKNNRCWAQYVLKDKTDTYCHLAVENEEYWYHSDLINSIRLVTDSTGAIKGEYRYSPFGNFEERKERGLYNPIMYNGKRYDEEINLYDYRTRFYNPDIAKFIQRDQIRNPNLYLFLENNPLTGIDILGKERKQATPTIFSQPLVTPEGPHDIFTKKMGTNRIII